MRIENHLARDPCIPAHPAVGALDDVAAADRASRRPSVGAAIPLETSGHTPAPELVHLLDLLQQTPEIRQDLVQQVAQRLAEGGYQTPAALEQTAEALLRR